MIAWLALIVSSIGLIFNIFTVLVDLLSRRKRTIIDSEGKYCTRYAQSQKICTHPMLSKLICKSGVCPREKCPGYSVDDEHDVSLSAFLKMIGTSFVPEIVTFLLSLNEIINGGTNL